MAKWPYSTAAWQRLRRLKLAQTPICELCPPGYVTPADTVDHRLAISEGGDPWAWDNLTSCCAKCHSMKTARGKEAGAAKTKKPMKGCDAKGNPLDQAHPWNQENRSQLKVYRPRGEALFDLVGDKSWD